MTMNKIWIPIVLVFLLGACTQVGVAKKVVVVKGAEISDSALNDAEWWMCSAASVGSIKRRYGLSQDRADLYKEFCDGTTGANVIGP